MATAIAQGMTRDEMFACALAQPGAEKQIDKAWARRATKAQRKARCPDI